MDEREPELRNCLREYQWWQKMTFAQTAVASISSEVEGVVARQQNRLQQKWAVPWLLDKMN